MDFLHQLFATQGFTLGHPVAFTLSPDGSRVLFLRSASGTDATRSLWSFDVASGTESLVAGPSAEPGEMSEQERIRRERQRDLSAGIAAYTTDDSVRTATFTAGGKLYVVDVLSATNAELPATEPVEDPRLSPDGESIAYVCDGALRVIGADGKDDRLLAAPDGPDVYWGLPDHVAAESMDRDRGFWWSPAGDQLVAARVDESPVQVWYISDPTHPAVEPRAMRYPAAGTDNARTDLWLLGLDGGRTAVTLDDPYVTTVTWDRTALLAVTQNRQQTRMRIHRIDPGTGATTVVREDTDEHWTTIVPGLPAHTAAGELVWSVDDGDTRRLTVDGEPVTPPGLQLLDLLPVDGDTVLFSATAEPTEWHLWTWSRADGLRQLSKEPGLYGGRRANGVTLIRSEDWSGWRNSVGGHSIRDVAAEVPPMPRPDLFAAGELGIRTAVLFPAGHVPGSRKLPVLMDPYGGSAMQRVLVARDFYPRSQWFADQGFAVVIADGRGTPGRGPAWERTTAGVHKHLIVDDQVDALHAAAERHPDLDLGRVAIRGWSAGGTLALMAVLRRPDVFHAAVAGAPVTDKRLYDTHWQERTLGLPDETPETYDRGDLIAEAADLHRPLLLIHGLADDNVFPVHSLKMSEALLAAGRPHSFLPLPGASHMVARADVMEFQARFLTDALSPVRWLD